MRAVRLRSGNRLLARITLRPHSHARAEHVSADGTERTSPVPRIVNDHSLDEFEVSRTREDPSASVANLEGVLSLHVFGAEIERDTFVNRLNQGSERLDMCLQLLPGARIKATQ